MSSVEHRSENGALVWVRNPFTGVVTYFTQVHRKRSGFVRPPRPGVADGVRPDEATRMADEMSRCPFCPGNEAACSEELLRVDGPGPPRGPGWRVRAVRNVVPRVPEICTGGCNESYVVVEDPRHFIDPTRSPELLYTGVLEVEHFQALFEAMREVARRSYANRHVRHVLVRKNQGWRSGASQPHPHSQVIGADREFPDVSLERGTMDRLPHVWEDVVEFVRDQGFVIFEDGGVIAYFSPFGAFPRSYEVVALGDRALMIDVPAANWRRFVAVLHRVLQMLGGMPLDYEIHDGRGIPLHAHVHARHFPYSSVGGTLNLPATLAEDPRQVRWQT